jgi:2-polyprenyl-6-methoxyphenol hydroxylase-like FAD-dependent oxidoreductase
LCLAQALLRAGFDVQVYERDGASDAGGDAERGEAPGGVAGLASDANGRRPACHAPFGAHGGNTALRDAALLAG